VREKEGREGHEALRERRRKDIESWVSERKWG